MEMLDDLDRRFGPTSEQSQKEAGQWFADLTSDWPK